MSQRTKDAKGTFREMVLLAIEEGAKFYDWEGSLGKCKNIHGLWKDDKTDVEHEGTILFQLEGVWTLGPWCTLPPCNTTNPLVAIEVLLTEDDFTIETWGDYEVYHGYVYPI